MKKVTLNQIRRRLHQPVLRHLPPILPKIGPSKVIHPSQQPGKHKKWGFTNTEDDFEEYSSEDEDDIDMEIEGNDSSGSSVDSDHIPTKRLRTSIVTHSFRTSPASEGPTTQLNTCPGSPSIASDSAPPNTEHEPDSEPETPSVSPGAGVDLAKGPTPHTAPPNPDLDVMEVDEPDANNAGAGIHELVDAQTATLSHMLLPSSHLRPDSELKIPEFMIGKHNTYSYLSTLKEPTFKTLLNGYLTFKLTNSSNIRSAFPTSHRPRGITWWTGRARPNKLLPYDSLNSFANSVIKWWTLLQPNWHKIKPGEVSHVEKGRKHWMRLYQPGVNGLLNVIILAYWWAKTLKERDAPVDDRYSWFVSDVTWVLSQLTRVAPEVKMVVHTMA